jgi:HK97 family phage portal protein
LSGAPSLCPDRRNPSCGLWYSPLVLEKMWSWLTEDLSQRQSPELDPGTAYPDIDQQLYERLRSQAAVGVPTVKEALGLPAIWRSISLLASAAASLNLVEYITSGANTFPALITSPFIRRPNPLWTPGAFVRDTVQFMAGWGENIWLVRKRDAAGFASSLLPVAPYSMSSTNWNGETLDWISIDSQGRQVAVAREDVVHIPLLRDPETGRGVGPLQRCGAAVTVAVEADNWARRWFVGGMPSLYLDSAMPIDELEATTVKDQWLADPPNIPKVGYGFTPTQIGWNPENAQLNGARMFNRGEVALMFGIPGRLLEYAESGTSVTYANVGDLATELVRLTLAPLYLEQIEQAFSDLLPRGHEVRFDVEELQRADIKTRYEVHEKEIALGIKDAAAVAKDEGLLRASGTVTPAQPEPQPLRAVS